MNIELINELLRSEDLTRYVSNLAIIFNDINSIEHILDEYNMFYYISALYNKNEQVTIKELQLYLLIDNINKFLEKINNIKYNITITIYPTFQYINDTITKLKYILSKLVILSNNTKLLLLSSFNYNDSNNPKQYTDFCLDAQFSRKIDYIKYNQLNYNVLSYIIKLKEDSYYAKYMFRSIKYSFNCYLTYYNLITKNTINIGIINININTKNKIKVYIMEILFHINMILDIYWNNYIKANKITMFLQSLIQDIEIMIVKAKQTDIEYKYKLSNNINVLFLLIQSYENNINNKLSIVVDYSKIQLFLSSILDHINTD